MNPRVPRPPAVPRVPPFQSDGAAKLCDEWVPKLHLCQVKKYDQRALRWDNQASSEQPVWPLALEFSFLELFESALVFIEQSIRRLDKGWYHADILAESISPEATHLILNLYVEYLLKDEE